MKAANRYSILGIAFALLTIGVFSSNGFFSIAMAGLNLARLPRELRLGLDSGLITPSQCSARSLRARCTKGEFGRKLGLLINQVGATEDSTLKGLAKLGIFNAFPSKGRLRRKEALEAMSRVCLLLSMKGTIKLPDGSAVNYKDYSIPAKYSSALNYMQKKFVVRGYPNGSLGANKRLTNREAVYFIYRLYEAISADMMANKKNSGIRFVDVSLSHPVMASIKTLTRAGAFDKVMLKPAFDGESNISTKELSEMAEGILARAKSQIDQIRIRTIFAGEPGQEKVNRSQLALVLEYLLGTPASTKESHHEINYTDIKKDSVEYEALKKLGGQGIWLGYHSGKFNSSESVTWYETVSAIEKVLKHSQHLTSSLEEKETENGRLAQKSDIDSFIALIKAKKARIRQILDRKRTYRR